MDSLVNRFQIAIQLLKRNMESDVQNKVESPITRPQTFMLYALNKFGQCKLSQLAEMMEVKPSAITVMIDRLERAGYVKRTHDTVDRRSVLVEMTPLGKEVLEKAIQERNKILETYLSRLEQEEIRLVTELLEKMVAPKSKETEKGSVDLGTFNTKEKVTIMIAIMVAMFFSAINQTIVSTAMPRIIAILGGMELLHMGHYDLYAYVNDCHCACW